MRSLLLAALLAACSPSAEEPPRGLDSGVTPVDAGTSEWWELGDSITFGEGTTPAEGYRRLLWAWSAHCAVRFLGTLTTGDWAGALHDGHPGYGIDGVSTVVRFRYGSQVPHADLVLLLVGTNDMGQDERRPYDPVTTSAKYAALLDQIAAVDDLTTILVSTIPPIDAQEYPGPAKNVLDFNARLAPLWDAFDRAHRTPLLRADFYARLAPWSTERFHDVWHPNAAGYALIAEEQERVLRASGRCP